MSGLGRPPHAWLLALPLQRVSALIPLRWAAASEGVLWLQPIHPVRGPQETVSVSREPRKRVKGQGRRRGLSLEHSVPPSASGLCTCYSLCFLHALPC